MAVELTEERGNSASDTPEPPSCSLRPKPERSPPKGERDAGKVRRHTVEHCRQPSGRDVPRDDEQQKASGKRLCGPESSTNHAPRDEMARKVVTWPRAWLGSCRRRSRRRRRHPSRSPQLSRSPHLGE